MTDLARLVVKLTAQTAEYEKKLDSANRKLSRFEKDTRGSLAKINGAFSKFGTALGAIGVGFSVGAIVTGLGSAAAKAIEYGDSIAKASAKTGVGAQAFSELAFAAKQNDIEFSALETAFKKLQVSISQAGSGSKAAQASFNALGIEFNSLRELRPEQQFELIAEQISRLQDPADRTRAAVELFGRAGADLLPLFEQGAEGVRKVREEAQRLGASLTEDQVQRLADADDAIKRLAGSWDALAVTLTANVAPAFATVLDAITNTLAEGERRTNSFREVWEAFKAEVREEGILWADAVGISERLQRRPEELLGGTRQATRSTLPRRPAAPPGFKPEDKPARSGGTRRTTAVSEQEQQLEQLRATYEEVYSRGVEVLEQLETPQQQITQRFDEQRYALETLAATYPAYAEQAQAALAQAAVVAQEQLDVLARSSVEQQRSQEIAAEGQAVYESTRTTVERWADEMVRLTELFEQGAISQETFTRAIDQANEAYEKVGDTVTDFERAANETLQGLLADVLFDPFSGGLDDMLQQWGQFLQRAAAEAIAAQLMEKLFGTEGIGSGGGVLGGIFGGASGIVSGEWDWMKGIGGVLGGIFGGGGGMASINGLDMALVGLAEGGLVEREIERSERLHLAVGGMVHEQALRDVERERSQRLASGGKVRGPGTATSDSIPAMLSAGEFVVRAEAVKQPGVLAMLERINSREAGALKVARHREAIPKFAVGGYIGRTPAMGIAAQMQSDDSVHNSTSVQITNQFTINAPAGTVSRATEMQIAAAAARGAQRASVRNN